MGIDTTIRTRKPFNAFQRKVVQVLCAGGPEVSFMRRFVSPGRYYGYDDWSAFRWPHNRRAILAVWVAGGFRGLDYDPDISVAFTGNHTPMTLARFLDLEKSYWRHRE